MEDCYFSARLSTERKRVADLVKAGENVLVMFSGVEPYVAVIAKILRQKRFTVLRLILLLINML